MQLQVDLPENPEHMQFLQTLDIDGISEHSQLFLLDTAKISQIIRNTLRHQIKEMDLKLLLQNNKTKEPMKVPFSSSYSRTNKHPVSMNLNHGEYFFKSSSDFPQIDSPSESSRDAHARALRRSRFNRQLHQWPLPSASVNPDWMFHSSHLHSFANTSSSSTDLRKRKRFAPEASSASKRIHLSPPQEKTDEIIVVSSSSDDDVEIVDMTKSSDVDFLNSSSSTLSDVQEM